MSQVVHGHDTTLPITLEEMLTHCKAVARGARRSFLVGDLPFGSYELGIRDAVSSAVRMLKEGGMDAVKIEGGSQGRVDAARAIVEAGVAVMGERKRGREREREGERERESFMIKRKYDRLLSPLPLPACLTPLAMGHSFLSLFSQQVTWV